MGSISDRTANLGTENAFVVLAEVGRLTAEGRDIVSFCIGQPDFVTPDNIREAAIKAIREGCTGYTPSAGIPRLRAAAAREIGRLRGIDVSPDHVVVAAGAKPFIGYAILSVTDHGQGHEVIYPNPGFPIYDSQIEAVGAVPVPLYLQEAHDFAFDPNELREKINDKTRLVILNSPHNPTGGTLTGAVLDEIAAILTEHEHVWIFADEIYSRLVYDGAFESIASYDGLRERTIIVDGASKTWAMTGWRIGYAANEKLAPYFTSWVTNTESCAPHPSQYAALEALEGPQDEPERMKKVFHRRRDLIVRLLGEVPGVECRMPGGAFYAWPNVTEACRMVGADDSEHFRLRLLHEAGVAVLADIHFGHRREGGGQHIRFSYATSDDAIEQGVERIVDFVKKNTR